MLLIISSCTQGADISGHWRPAYAGNSVKDLIGDPPQSGDLLINDDSTFVSVGIENQPTQIEGWQTGTSQKGKWSFSNQILSLKPDSIPITIKYKVVKLTKDEVIMHTLFNESFDSIKVRLVRL